MIKKVNTIIGGGEISAELSQKLNNNGIVTNVFSIRKLESKSIINYMLTTSSSSEVIFYLAYEHNNFIKNIKIFNSTLDYLFKIKWQGTFVFINTQLTLSGIFKDGSSGRKYNFPYDIYTFTKHLQRKRIKKYANAKFKIIDLYLPVVLGNTKAEENFKEIANFNCIYLPNGGKNNFAYCDMESLVRFLSDTTNGLLSTSGQQEKGHNGISNLFLYSGLMSFRDCIERHGKTEIRRLTNNRDYHSNLYQNILWKIKRSTFGLIIYIIKSSIFNVLEKNKQERYQGKTKLSTRFSNHTFTPSGFDRKFMAIDASMSDLEIRTTKI